MGAAPFEEPRQLRPELLVALGGRSVVGVERAQEALESVLRRLPAGSLGTGIAQGVRLQGRRL
jgi:hypothetical protein